VDGMEDQCWFRVMGERRPYREDLSGALLCTRSRSLAIAEPRLLGEKAHLGVKDGGRVTKLVCRAFRQHELPLTQDFTLTKMPSSDQSIPTLIAWPTADEDSLVGTLLLDAIGVDGEPGTEREDFDKGLSDGQTGELH
jgi:hypothetical protein